MRPRRPPDRQKALSWWVWLATCLVAGYALWLPLRYASLNSSTFDEGNHLATGLEWWQYGRYEWFTVTPPLARVAVAALPYAAGVRLPPRAEWDPHHHSFFTAHVVGEQVLGSGAEYEQRLQLARYGTLGFLALLLLGTWALARGRRHPVAGLMAVSFIACVPAVTAHASLATTDVALAAVWVWFLVVALAYYRRPTWPRAMALGTVVAAGLLTKFSFLVLAPLGALVALLVVPRGARLQRIVKLRRAMPKHGGALALACLVVWAGYRFSWGPVGSLPSGSGELSAFDPIEQLAPWQRLALSVPVPAPELVHGLLFAARHQAAPQPTYLFGERSSDGFPLFYLTSLLVKTPLAGLLMTFGALFVAAGSCVRRSRCAALTRPWCWGLTLLMLAVSTASRYNLGVRHLLPVYPLLAVSVAGAVAACWRLLARRQLGRWALSALVVALFSSQAAASFRARRDPLAHFNSLVGREPGAVLLGSDFDWGQDLFRLRSFTQRHNVERLSIAYFGMGNPCRHGLPALKPLEALRPTTGWIAISETFFRGHGGFAASPDPCDRLKTLGPPVPGAFRWLERHQPAAQLGALRVYHVAEVAPLATSPSAADATSRATIFELELAEAGADVVRRRDGATEYVTALTDAPEAMRPADPRRIVSLRVTVPLPGAYDLYLRYRVGPNRYDDDSLFVAKQLGAREPSEHAQWDIVNGLVAVGYSQAEEIIGGGAGAAIERELSAPAGTRSSWRWINLSAYRRRTPGFRFTSRQPQALQVAVREDGLELDKLVLVPAGAKQRVAELDAGVVRTIVEQAPRPVPQFVPQGPALAAGHEKYLGGVYSASQRVNFRAYFDHVTPENAGKWGSVEMERDVMDWRELDAAYALAKSEQPSLPFRMHTLIWGNQQPGWIEDLPVDEQREEIREWFEAVASRYGEHLDYVEVVNEPLRDPPSQRGMGGGNYIEALGGTGEDGWQWVKNAFELARELFPNAKLMINEYGVLDGSEQAVRYAALVRTLKEAKLLDVIGVQAHELTVRLDSPTLSASLQALSRVGLPIVISELDIAEPDDSRQLAEFQRLFPLLWEHSSVEGIVLWGYRPGMWMGARGAILAHEHGVERPALKWLREYLRESSEQHRR